MSRQNKFRFKSLPVFWKIFLSIYLVLALNLILVTFFGRQLTGWFYRHNMQELIQSYAFLIKTVPDEALTDTVYDAEQHGMDVLLFRYSEEEETSQKISPIYYSRSESGTRGGYTKNLTEAVQDGVLEQCTEVPVILYSEHSESGDESDRGFMRLFFFMEDNVYLMLEMPLSSVEDAAGYARQIMAYLSALMLFIGSIAAWVVSRRIAKPIQEIDAVARRITEMDFTQRCTANSGDEIGRLAENVNRMADRLAENIDLLTQRNQLLQRDLEREETTGRQRRDLIASVSHDFKTPLAVIQGYAETILPELEGENAEDCVQIIEQSKRMNGMVNHLLSLSRLESGMVEPKPTVFAMEDVIYESLTALKPVLTGRFLKVEPLPNGEWFVNADYNLTMQVVTNLLENASKYATGESPFIRIEFEKKGLTLRTTVFNTADPIPEESLPHLFEGFYRADRSRRQTSNSYGFGLAIVKAVTNLHQCACGVENREGGVAFWFDLPIAEMPPEEDCFEDEEDLPEEETIPEEKI